MDQVGLVHRRRGNRTPDIDHVTDSASHSPTPSPVSPDSPTLEDDAHQYPKYTLMEELILLAIDKNGTLPPAHNLSCSIRGLIMIELGLRGRIALGNDPSCNIHNQYVYATDDRSTGEPILNETLRLICNDSELTVSAWTRLLTGIVDDLRHFTRFHYRLRDLCERLMKRLVDKDALGNSKTMFLGWVSRISHPLLKADDQLSLKTKCCNTLLGRGKKPDIRAYALVCAAYQSNILDTVFDNVLDNDKQDQALKRMQELFSDICSCSSKVASANSDIMAAVFYSLQEQT